MMLSTSKFILILYFPFFRNDTNRLCMIFSSTFEAAISIENGLWLQNIIGSSTRTAMYSLFRNTSPWNGRLIKGLIIYIKRTQQILEQWGWRQSHPVLLSYSVLYNIWNIWKAQWKHSYLTLKFTGNGLALSTNKYCGFNVTLTCGAIDEKWNLQCPELEVHNRIEGIVSCPELKVHNRIEGMVSCPELKVHNRIEGIVSCPELKVHNRIEGIVSCPELKVHNRIEGIVSLFTLWIHESFAYIQ